MPDVLITTKSGIKKRVRFATMPTAADIDSVSQQIDASAKPKAPARTGTGGFQEDQGNDGRALGVRGFEGAKAGANVSQNVSQANPKAAPEMRPRKSAPKAKWEQYRDTPKSSVNQELKKVPPPDEDTKAVHKLVRMMGGQEPVTYDTINKGREALNRQAIERVTNDPLTELIANLELAANPASKFAGKKGLTGQLGGALAGGITGAPEVALRVAGAVAPGATPMQRVEDAVVGAFEIATATKGKEIAQGLGKAFNKLAPGARQWLKNLGVEAGKKAGIKPIPPQEVHRIIQDFDIGRKPNADALEFVRTGKVPDPQPVPVNAPEAPPSQVLAQALKAHGGYSDKQIDALITGLNPVLEQNPGALFAAVKKIDPSGKLLQEFVQPFYSKLERVVQDKVPNRASAEQIRNTLVSAGVKAEEMQWTRMDDLLGRGGTITKQDILDHIAENQVRVEEVMKGTGGGKPGESYADGQTRLQNRAIALARENRIPYEEAYAQALRESGGPTKFGQYTLPGGQNYRELLLTLPQRKLTIDADWVTEQVRQNLEHTTGGSSMADTTQWKTTINGQTARITFNPHKGKYVLNMEYVPNKRHVANAHFDSLEEAQSYATHQETGGARGMGYMDETQNFRGSHWDEPNVLAHIRFDERTGPNGERILHVAEIQSDWHQKGRKKGYASDNLEPQVQAIAKRVSNGERDFLNNGDMELLTPEEAAIVRQYEGRVDAVPDAPFKGNAWKELSMKRILRYAAENDFDRVSWDTGITNADRYDLSKQIRGLTVLPNDPGTVKLSGLGLDGERVNFGTHKIEDLPDVIGKELAQRIADDIAAKPNEGGFHYSGLDLKVGGEGMKGFYDSELPNIANKIGKRFGAKVEGVGGPQYPGERAIAGVTVPKDAHSIAITPEMRSSLLNEGQPLFQQGKEGIKGAYNPSTRVIELVEGKADVSTVIHEVAHDWHGFLKDHAELGKTIRNVYGDTTEGAERFAKHFEGFLRSGKAPHKSMQRVFESIREWMREIYSRFTGGKAPKEVEAIFKRTYANPSDETLRLAREFDAKYAKPETPPATQPKAGGQVSKQERHAIYASSDESLKEWYPSVKEAASQGDTKSREILGLLEERLRSSKHAEDFVRTQIDGLPPSTPMEEALRLSISNKLAEIRAVDPMAADRLASQMDPDFYTVGATARKVAGGGSEPPRGSNPTSGGQGGGMDPRVEPLATEVETMFGKLRAISRSFRLASVVNRLKDIAQNTVNTTMELGGKNLDVALDRILFPKARREYGAASGLISPGMVKNALAGSRARWTKEIGEQLKKGNVGELAKFGITKEAPGILKYVGRATGVTDIPYRDLWHRITVAELQRANPRLSMGEIETIALNEELLQVFANENILGDVQKFLESKAAGKESGQAALLATDLAIPFPKIIGNVAGRATDYAYGSIKAGWDVFNHARSSASKKAAAKGSLFPDLGAVPMSVDQRRVVNALVRRNLVGIAGVTAGYFLHQNGVLRPEEVNTKSGYMRWDENFENIGGAFAKALILGATYAELNKGATTDKQALKLAGNGIASIWDQPAISGGAKLGAILDTGDPTRASKEAGRMVASGGIPAEVRNLAKWLDSKRDRKRAGFTDEIKNAIPRLRESLPPK